MTEQEAKAWVGKHVYSSDGKKLGEVAAILRTADNSPNCAPISAASWASASIRSLFRRPVLPCTTTALCLT